MNKEKIIKHWESEIPQYEAWGEFIKQYVAQKIFQMNGVLIEDFLESFRIRTKNPDSLCDKMVKKGKRYEDIRDKVGIRFIVFVKEDIDVIDNAIKVGRDMWECEQKRHAQDQRTDEPEWFRYIGHHYIIKNKKKLSFEGIDIPPNIVCEVQVRTIFEHAAECFSHHYEYKKGYRTLEFKREIAKMRALAEIVDEWSVGVAGKIGNMKDPWSHAYSQLEEYYMENVCHSIAHVKSAMDILRSSNPDELQDLKQKIENFCKDHHCIIKTIRDRSEHHRLFHSPVILLIYLKVNSLTYPKNISPFMTDSLKLVYGDLGKKFED